MQSQYGYNLAEWYFQKGEYIAIGHDSFKMLSSPKGEQFEGGRLYAFLGNGGVVSEKLISSLCDYAKSACFYKSESRNDKIYVLCLFSKNEFTQCERELMLKNGRSVCGTVCFTAGFESLTQNVYKSQKPPLFASELSRKAFNIFNKITCQDKAK